MKSEQKQQASEKHLERKLTEKVKIAGGLALKFNAAKFTGMPDRVVLMPNGRIWFVETKTTGKTLEPRQKLVHNQLQQLGFNVRTVDTSEKLENFIDEIIKC